MVNVCALLNEYVNKSLNEIRSSNKVIASLQKDSTWIKRLYSCRCLYELLCECASHRVFGMASQLTGEMSWMENFSCSGCMYRSSEKTTIQIIKTPSNQTHSLYPWAHASKPCPTSFDGLILLLLSGHSGDACALLFNTGAHRIHLKHKRLINIWLPRLLIAAQILNTEELCFSSDSTLMWVARLRTGFTLICWVHIFAL